jgi:DNA gyrase subunit A
MAFDLSRKGGRLVASFPVESGDGILLVTDGAQLIRVPVGRIRIASRNTQGVIIFRTGDKEKVVSVERLAEASGGGDSDEEPDVEIGPEEGPAPEGETPEADGDVTE